MSSNRKRLAARLFLLKEMVVRDIRARYAGSGLGVFWAFGQPVLWLLLYAWVFGLILRIPVEKGFAGFPEFLLAGLLPWMAIQEGIWRVVGPDRQRGHGQENCLSGGDPGFLSRPGGGRQPDHRLCCLRGIPCLARAPFPSVGAPGAARPSASGVSDVRSRVLRRDRHDLPPRPVPRDRNRIDRPLLRDSDRLSGHVHASSLPLDPGAQPDRASGRVVSPRLHAARSPRSLFGPVPDAFLRSRGDPGLRAVLSRPAPFRGPDLNAKGRMPPRQLMGAAAF